MKILGIGVDIIENKRIKESIKNNKFKSDNEPLDVNCSNLSLKKNKKNYACWRFRTGNCYGEYAN